MDGQLLVAKKQKFNVVINVSVIRSSSVTVDHGLRFPFIVFAV